MYIIMEFTSENTTNTTTQLLTSDSYTVTPLKYCFGKSCKVCQAILPSYLLYYNVNMITDAVRKIDLVLCRTGRDSVFHQCL